MNKPGWPDLADCIRNVQASSPRRDYIDLGKLLAGTVTVFHAGCERYFTHLQTAGADRLREIFDVILSRDDCNMDMVPSALTYFGSDGLSVLNQVATETRDICEALHGYCDRQLFDVDR